MFILESVMRAIKNLRLGVLCLSFIFTTGCSTMAEAFGDTFCQSVGIMGGGSDSLWATVTIPVCLVGIVAFLPVVAIEKSIERANDDRKRKAYTQQLHDRIKAGDLAASEDCVLYACDYGYSFPNFSETWRRAAENVLKAYQDEPEPNLKTQVLLIFAHDDMAHALKNEPPESRRAHLEAIVRFGESKELWDYVKDPDFKSFKLSDSHSQRRLKESKGVSPYYIEQVQKKMNKAVIMLLAMDYGSRVAGDPYQPFVCDLALYQRAADLVKVENYGVGRDWPCKKAEEEWEDQAIKQVKERIGSGDLAAAERCLLDCAKIKGENWFLGGIWDAARLRRFAARSLIKAYESLPELDSHQHEMLEKARALKAESP